MSLELLINRSPLVAKAYEFAKRAHDTQLKYGEPHIDHCVNTALLLEKWHLDDIAIASGLLHDVVEDTNTKLDEVRKEFGEEIKSLVDGATRIKAIKFDIEKAETDTLMKMFIAMTKDLRVIMIKLASRRDNLRHIRKLRDEEKLKIARETMEIHAPIAYRLGMQNLSGELEDIVFPYLYPEEYKWLVENVREKYEDREKYLRDIKPIVEEALIGNDIKPVAIHFRAKRHASLYKKLLRYDMDLEKIYDLIAFRIIVNDIKDCYAVPGIIHKLWSPLPGRIKDYVAIPKPNGYQSIHTTVLCDDQRIVEFQVKTAEMHDRAENGIAAHWAYAQGKNTKSYAKRQSPFADPKDIHLINQLRSWQQFLSSPNELIESLKVDFFDDRIFAITPKGEVVDLPQGATPIDFAYKIHERVGNEALGAKVNGKMVSLDYKLHSEDVVEIARQKNKKPSASWLEFVVTSNAKSHIKKALKKTSGFVGYHNPKAEFKVTLENKIGLLKKISEVISRSHINILSINSNEQGKLPALRIKCDLGDVEKAKKLAAKLGNLKGVREVHYHLG